MFEETTIIAEHKNVLDTLKTAEPYSDMAQFCSSCMKWLVVLIKMGPHGCQNLIEGCEQSEEEPLSPKSSDLRSNVLQTRAPLAEMMTKYESNLKGKLADVQSIRKRLDKMVQKQCDLSACKTTGRTVRTVKQYQDNNHYDHYVSGIFESVCIV